MSIVPLIIQLAAGAVGGNIAGTLLKNFNLCPLGNSIAGIVGGGLGGQLLSLLTSGGAAAAAAPAAGMDQLHRFQPSRGRCWRSRGNGHRWLDQVENVQLLAPNLLIMHSPGSGRGFSVAVLSRTAAAQLRSSPSCRAPAADGSRPFPIL